MSDTAPSGVAENGHIDLVEPAPQQNIAAQMLFTDETPEGLIPQLGLAARNSVFYDRLVMTELGLDGSEFDDIEEQVDPFADSGAARRGADKPALGVLLRFEQGWRQEGLALGELRYSLSLAPGEVTQVSVVDWRRSTRASSTDATSQAEIVASQSDGAQTQNAIQAAVENQSRDTTAVNIGSSRQSQVGVSGGGLLFGGSASHAESAQLGLSATSATGSRDVTTASRESIQRRTTEAAQAVRSRRSTSVREVSENERSEATTRVVANYNHMHALTMQYFEVLQVYELSTKVVEAERCVFIPMKIFRFRDLEDHPDVIEVLRSVLVDLGADALITSLDSLRRDASLADELANAQAERAELQDRMKETWMAVEVAVRRLPAEWPGGMMVPPPDEHVIIEHLEQYLYGGGRLFPRVNDGPSMAMQGAVDFLAPEGREALNILVHDIAVRREFDTKIAALREAVPRHDSFFEILEDNELFLNQQMWMRMEQHRWHQLMLGRSHDGQPLGGLVDPAPIGFFGNYVAFRWDFPVYDGDSKNDPRRLFERSFMRNGSRDIQSRIVVPSEGVFAEAVLGQSNSAERIDLTRFWNWQDSPIPILPPSIQPVGNDSRSREVSFGNLDFAAAIAALSQKDLVAASADDPAIITALQGALLGDSGLGAAASAAAGAGANATAGAAHAQDASLQVSKQVQDFVVGIANSEVGKIAATAGMGAATGGVSTVGGLVNAAVKVGGKAAAKQIAESAKGGS